MNFRKYYIFPQYKNNVISTFMIITFMIITVIIITDCNFNNTCLVNMSHCFWLCKKEFVPRVFENNNFKIFGGLLKFVLNSFILSRGSDITGTVKNKIRQLPRNGCFLTLSKTMGKNLDVIALTVFTMRFTKDSYIFKTINCCILFLSFFSNGPNVTESRWSELEYVIKRGIN